MQLSLYDEYGFPSGSGGAIGGDDIPRFLNRYPSLAMKRLDKIEEEVDGGTVYHKPASAAGKLMAVVAMDTATKERIDLTDKITEGVIVWKVPEGRWKIMQFVCVNDGDPNMDYLSKDAAKAYVTMTHEQYYKRFPNISVRPSPKRFSTNRPFTGPKDGSGPPLSTMNTVPGTVPLPHFTTRRCGTTSAPKPRRHAMHCLRCAATCMPKRTR